MDKEKFAERLLSMAMEPAQAASVVGDLLEASSSRNVIWFWTNVFQTFAATIWRDVKAQPLFIVRVAAYGMLAQIGLGMIVAMACALVIFVASRFIPHLVGYAWAYPLFFVSQLLPPFYAGRWIALKSSGKDVAICVAMTVGMPVVFDSINALLVWGVPLLSTNFAIPELYSRWWDWTDIVRLVACVAGAALVRRRRQIATPLF
jgi:hypothetical protein